MTVAGQGQVPVDTLLGQQARRPSKWRSMLAWRDWSLPMKLAAITFIPLLVAVLLGTIAIVGQAGETGRLDHTQRLASLSARVHTLLADIRDERAITARLLTEGTPGGSSELSSAQRAVDTGIERFGAGVQAMELEQGSKLAQRSAAVTTSLDSVSGIREQVAAGQLDAVQAITAYSEVTDALLDLDTALVAALNADGFAGASGAAHQLLVAADLLAIERGMVGYGIERSALPPSQLDRLRAVEARFTERLADFRLMAEPGQLDTFTAAVGKQALDTREQLVSEVLNGDPTGSGESISTIGQQQWADSSTAVLAAVDTVAAGMREQLATTAAESASEATWTLVALSVGLFLALALAALACFAISRQLLGSLRQLRSSAIEIGRDRLPAVVEAIQRGESDNAEIGAVPVRTADEVGQVARAFDEVHGQAVRLAADQAALRTAYGNVFVNLSRRSQSLVQRQLQLIERLERDEEDADQLATLFQLDHLATRMRRNNENLLVLSGGESGRRSGAPVTVNDVLRAAVSEIEQYQRVAVRAAPETRVVGHVASDLMRLLAELMDNATAFSAPDTHVTLATRLTEERALSIDVLDKGIGMNATEVGEANARIVEAASVDLATSRRMGLFVVGRLASKHGIRVVLHGGKDITGVRANVLIPADLLAGAAGSMPVPAQGQQPSAQAGGAGALPKRTRPVNGSGAGSIASRLAGSQRDGAASAGAGAAPEAEPPSSENEVSGTALFTPISSTDSAGGGSGQDGEQTRPEQSSPEQAEQPEQPETVSDGDTSAGADAAAEGPADQRDAEPPPAASEPDSGSESVGSAAKDDLPVGKELFAANGTPLTRWWTAAAKARDEAERTDSGTTNSTTETTPIFNEMVSAWFRAASPESEQDGGDVPASEHNTGRWAFAADVSRRTVDTVSRTEPKSYTPAGLPRRNKGDQLLPGSVDETRSAAASGQQDVSDDTERSDVAATADKPSRQLPVRDPADVRGRLSSFQRGVTQGKQQRRPEPDTADAPESSPALAAEGTTERVVPEQPGADWSFAADAGLREVRSVGDSKPANYTEAGLPRRRRGEQLLPGSASDAESVPGPRTERDPENVRGRLSSFQQGVRRGRHQTTQPTDGNHEHMEGE